jgi:hypothetical protein
MFRKNDYIHLKDVVTKHFSRKGYSKFKVAQYGALSGIPLIILYEFIGEEFPEHEKECEKQRNFLKEYFRY